MDACMDASNWTVAFRVLAPMFFFACGMIFDRLLVHATIIPKLHRRIEVLRNRWLKKTQGASNAKR